MKNTQLHSFLAKRTVLALVTLLLVCPLFLSGQTQIGDAAGLKAIAENLDGDYELTADISLTEFWSPIGTEEAPFTGKINGNGHVIRGLKIAAPLQGGVGLIGVAKGALISKIGIEGAAVEGKNDVGAIVGRIYAPTIISECYSSGTIRGFDHVAGIIGGTKSSSSPGERSEIINSFSTAVVISSTYQAAGIVGTSFDVLVKNNYFAGVCLNGNTNTGGIVALIDGATESLGELSTEISNNLVVASFIKGGEATSRILGNANNLKHTLSNNYAWEGTKIYKKGVETAIKEEDNNSSSKEGLSKTIDEIMMVSFYKNTLMWDENIWNFNEGKLPHLSYQELPIDVDLLSVSFETSTMAVGLEIETSFFSVLRKKVTCSSSNTEVATIDEYGKISSLAVGKTTLSFSTADDAFSKGISVIRELEVVDVSSNITNETELSGIRYKLDGEYTLMNDIVLSENWEPIANFTGKFNGNGHVIYNLRIETKEKNNVALFANTIGAEIVKLGIENAHLIGNADVAAIVGQMRGTVIKECYVANSYIEGRDHVASISGAILADGEKKSVILDCYSSAEIKAREYQAGGIAGIINGGDLLNCYYAGIISCPNRSAGIVSLVDGDASGKIGNSVNLASFIIGRATMRIVDNQEKSTTILENNYSLKNSKLGANMELAGSRTSTDANGIDGKDVDKDLDLLSADFYKETLNWNFDDIWSLPSSGNMYPILKWQKMPLKTNVFNVPDKAFLLWGEDDSYINLKNLVKGAHGQTLSFQLDSEEFGELVDGVLYPTEKPISTNGKVVVTVKNSVESTSSIIELPPTTFSVSIYKKDLLKFNINTKEELLEIQDLLIADYRLMSDLDLEGVDFGGFGSDGRPYTGTFDGNGHTISNITIVKQDKCGFFNVTQGATIKNLGLLDVQIEGSADVGGLVGKSTNTTISECYVTGKIIGKDHVAALVGGDFGATKLINSYANAEVVTSIAQVGGLVGVINGIEIQNCYFVGSVMAPTASWQNNASGIASLMESGNNSIVGTVSMANVTGGTAARFLARANFTDNVMMKLQEFKNNLYSIDALIHDGDKGGYENQTDERPLPVPSDARSSAELKKKATYEAIGWDFNEIWMIDEGASYPYLQNKDATSIKELKTEQLNYGIFVANNEVQISDIKEPTTICIFSVTGNFISKVVTKDNVVTLGLPYKGLYVLRINKANTFYSVKIINK